MPSSVVEPGDGIGDRVAALCGQAIVEVRSIGRGGNNRLWRVTAADGARYALKSYAPASEADPRDRLGTEFRSLEFLWRHGVRNIPEPVVADMQAGFGVYRWVDGGDVHSVGSNDIDVALGFAECLQGLRFAEGAECLSLASEACLSGRELDRQIKERMVRLHMLNSEPELNGFLERSAYPLVQRFMQRAQDRYESQGFDFFADIDAANMTLSSSDFGFHNALRKRDGGLVFLDFEYFGWDDPVKLVADFLWHPGMYLNPEFRRRFEVGALKIFGSDPCFRARLSALLPLYGIRWSLIVLNVFKPSYWASREELQVHAGESWEVVKLRQLAKAKAILTIVEEQQL